MVLVFLRYGGIPVSYTHLDVYKRQIINNETGRLYNMVEELLDFSRLQNGRSRMRCV